MVDTEVDMHLDMVVHMEEDMVDLPDILSAILAIYFVILMLIQQQVLNIKQHAMKLKLLLVIANKL